MAFHLRLITLWFLIFTPLYIVVTADDYAHSVSNVAVRKAPETNIFNFIRLFVLRMVYGFANMFGFSDFLEDFAGGIFAPPEPEYGGLSSSDYSNENDDYKEYDDYIY